MLRDVRVGHDDGGRDVEENFEDRPGYERDLLVVAGHGPIHDPELLGLGVEAQKARDVADGLSDGRRVAPTEHQCQRISLGARSYADVTGILDTAKLIQQLVELRIRRPNMFVRNATRHTAVVDAVDRLHGEPQHHVDREPGLEHVHDGRRRNIRHHRACKTLPRHRRVRDGRAVVVYNPGRPSQDAGDGIERRPLVECIDSRGARESPLYRVAGDDLPDVHEHRDVAVAHLHEVQQHLSLPRLAHGCAVVETIPGHRARPHAFASCHGEQGQEQKRPDRT